MFLNPPTPPSGMSSAAGCIGCIDDGARDLGTMVGNTHNAATNTFELYRAACGPSLYTPPHAPLRLKGARATSHAPQSLKCVGSRCCSLLSQSMVVCCCVKSALVWLY